MSPFDCGFADGYDGAPYRKFNNDWTEEDYDQYVEGFLQGEDEAIEDSYSGEYD
jgi:hypothetical protein